MIKRNGTYYFMWSEGGWTGPDYSVSYAMSDSPLGPFVRKAKILQQDSAVAKGSGHHGVINIPGTDIWYIVYHRRPLSESDGNHRVLAYDRMYFNEDGTIAPVRMLVQDNFADGNMIGWTTHGGSWSVVNQRLTASEGSTGLAMLDTNFTSLILDATVSLPEADGLVGEAGLVFQAHDFDNDNGDFTGYYTGLSVSGNLVLSLVDRGDNKILAQKPVSQPGSREHRLRVVANGTSILVYLDNMDIPEINTTASIANGATGVRVAHTAARFGHISVTKTTNPGT